MSAEIIKWVAACKPCQRHKALRQGKNRPLQPIPAATGPFKCVGLDLMGLFQESDVGNKWILVMINYLTKWPIAVPLPNKCATMVAWAFVEQLVCVHGAPESLLLDKGCEFLNEVLASMNLDLHVHCLKTLAYHPQTDGLMEHFNSMLQNMLSMYVSDHQCNWDTYIPYVLAAYCCSVNKAMMEMLFFLTFGRDHYLPINVSLSLPQVRADEDTEDYHSRLVEQLMLAFCAAKEHQLEAQEHNCCSYNHDKQDQPFKLGNKVWLYVPVVQKQWSKKFLRPWQGPYQIVKL